MVTNVTAWVSRMNILDTFATPSRVKRQWRIIYYVNLFYN
jgi:hypothetical protein